GTTAPHTGVPGGGRPEPYDVATTAAAVCMHTHLVNREAAVPKPRLEATVRPARPDCQNPAWPKGVISPPHAPDIVKTVVLAARHALGSIVNVEQDGVVLGRTGLNGTAH